MIRRMTGYGTLALFSRSGLNCTKRFPPIAAALAHTKKALPRSFSEGAKARTSSTLGTPGPALPHDDSGIGRTATPYSSPGTEPTLERFELGI
jgi:hypothetical protein